MKNKNEVTFDLKGSIKKKDEIQFVTERIFLEDNKKFDNETIWHYNDSQKNIICNEEVKKMFYNFISELNLSKWLKYIN